MVIVKKLKPTNQPKKPTPLPPRQKKPQPSNQNQPIKQNPKASNHPATKAKQNTSVRDSSVRNNFNVPYTGESRKKINEVWTKSCSQSDSLLTYPNHLRAQEIFLLRRWWRKETPTPKPERNCKKPTAKFKACSWLCWSVVSWAVLLFTLLCAVTHSCFIPTEEGLPA